MKKAAVLASILSLGLLSSCLASGKSFKDVTGHETSETVEITFNYGRMFSAEGSLEQEKWNDVLLYLDTVYQKVSKNVPNEKDWKIEYTVYFVLGSTDFTHFYLIDDYLYAENGENLYCSIGVTALTPTSFGPSTNS